MAEVNEFDIQGIICKDPPRPPYKEIRNYGLPKRNQVWSRHTEYENWDWNTDPEYGPMWYDEPEEGQMEWFEEEISRINNGEWIFIDGVATYLNPWCYFFHQWHTLQSGIYPQYRDTSLEFFRVWHAIDNDPFTLGLIGIKGRRLGMSSMAASIQLRIGLTEKNTLQGIVSKTGTDAKEMYLMIKNSLENLPPFLMPSIRNIGEKEIHLATPRERISKNNQKVNPNKGLNNRLTWLPLAENAYDGRELRCLIIDEAAKYEEANVTKLFSKISETLVTGANVVGKVMMFSTVNAPDKGGANFEILWTQSDHTDKKGLDELGQTTSRMKRFFIPGYRGVQGYIDHAGNSVVDTPTPEQRDYLKSLKDHRGNPMCANPNIGSKAFRQSRRDALEKAGDMEGLAEECFSPDVKIMTANGDFVEVDKIKVGDLVMVEGGKVKTVINRFDGTDEMYKVIQPYGKDYIVSSNHRLYVEHRMGGGDKRDGIHKVRAKDFHNYFSNSSKRVVKRVNSSGVEFPKKNLPIPPYLMGLWLGDGDSDCFRFTVNKNTDREIIDYLKSYCETNKCRYSEKPLKYTKEAIRFSILKDEDSSRYNRHIELLKDLGVYNNKHIPEMYMKSCLKDRLELLAGLIDTDGYVLGNGSHKNGDKRRQSLGIAMSREHLVQQIRYVALSCGFTCTNIKHKKSNYGTDVYSIKIYGDLYKIPIKLERKSFNGITPYYKSRLNKIDVIPIGLGKYVGLEVDADNDDDRRLILEDFTLTLNCRKFPFTWQEAFDAANENCLFDMEKLNRREEELKQKLYELGRDIQKGELGRRGMWARGESGSIHWVDDPKGIVYIDSFLPKGQECQYEIVNGKKVPTNEDFGAAGFDPLGMHQSTAEEGSDACLIVRRRYHGNDPDNSGKPVAMVLGRTDHPDKMHEQVYMTLEYYGVKMLAERAVESWLVYAEDHGLTGYLYATQRKTDGKVVYGIVNQQKEAVKEDHAAVQVKASIEDIPKIPFIRLIRDRKFFSVKDRTKYDACMADGYALMALRYYSEKPKKVVTKGKKFFITGRVLNSR